MIFSRTVTAAGVLFALAGLTPANAGWNNCGCGYGYSAYGYASYGYAGYGYAGYGYGYAPPQVYYAQPTVSYAPPTYTIQPHYVVQPNVVVERTQVIPQTQYVQETVPYQGDAFYSGDAFGYEGQAAYANVGFAPRGPYLGTFSRPRYYGGARHRHARYWVGYRAYRHAQVYRGHAYRGHSYRPYNRWHRW
jgi:hypothetical protein